MWNSSVENVSQRLNLTDVRRHPAGSKHALGVGTVRVASVLVSCRQLLLRFLVTGVIKWSAFFQCCWVFEWNIFGLAQNWNWFSTVPWLLRRPVSTNPEWQTRTASFFAKMVFFRCRNSFQEHPFIHYHKDHKHRDGNDKFEGFCVDLLKEVARKIGFQYEIYTVPDGQIGQKYPNGSWSGVIGELVRGVKCFFSIYQLAGGLWFTISWTDIKFP